MAIILKQAVYNADKTECLEIGYEWYDNQISIIPFPRTIKKVPSALPKEITSLELAFSRNQNAFINGIQDWDNSNITNMNYMFCWAKNFNQDISMWHVSNVTDMSYMFYGAENFNQDISMWNTSKVKYMSFMFYNATSFNQDLSKWDTSNVNAFGQNIGASNPNWKPEHQPQFNK
ncbi:BspA family leucine-rich repeat surface protein [Mycoplasma capricolum]|uniref:BspA family leucine-rich repeat surface protein n=1 Tax=Mycoplasma capricolum TaxID=2095 RepID=UPI003DA6BCED